jgi:hypothetical protein
MEKRGHSHCCSTYSLSFMPVYWVLRERVGVRGLKSDYCTNSNPLILSFSRREKGYSVYVVVMRIDAQNALIADISLFMLDYIDIPFNVYLTAARMSPLRVSP